MSNIVSRRDAARMLGISINTLDRLRRDGALDSVPIGARRVFLMRDQVEAYQAGDGTLSLREAADQLGVSEKTLSRMIKGGEIDAVRIGRRVRLLPSAISTYIARHGGSASTVKNAADDFIIALCDLGADDIAGWILYVLEGVDSEAPALADSAESTRIWYRIMVAIEGRLQAGAW